MVGLEIEMYDQAVSRDMTRHRSRPSSLSTPLYIRLGIEGKYGRRRAGDIGKI
jgi:hypothetical protein